MTERTTPVPAGLVAYINMETTTSVRVEIDVRELVADNPELWAKYGRRRDLTPTQRVEKFVAEIAAEFSADELTEMPGYVPNSKYLDDHHDTDVTSTAELEDVETLNAIDDRSTASVIDHTAEIHRRYADLVAAGKSTKAVW